MLKKQLIIFWVIFNTLVFAGQCQIDRGAVSKDYFVLNNQLNSDITVSLYEKGDHVPTESPTVGAMGSLQNSDAAVIQICAYKKISLSHHVTKSVRIACCHSEQGFLGDQIALSDQETTITYHGATITQDDLENTATSNTRLSGKVLGATMGY